MAKDFKDYTQDELIELGRKALEVRLKDKDRAKKHAEVDRKLWALYKANKITNMPFKKD